MFIQRHAIDRQFVQELFQATSELQSELIPVVPERSSTLESLVWNAAELFETSSVLTPQSAKLRSFARLTAQANAVIFRFIAFPGQPVRATIGDLGTLEFAWYRPRSEDHASSLIYTYSYAAMAREQAVLDMLADVPTQVARYSQAQSDEYLHLFAAALQSYHRQDGHTRELLDAGRAAAAPERVEISTPEVTHKTTYAMDALEALLDRDEQRFNQALYDAVSAHKRHFDTEELAWHMDGYVDRDALGLACLAHDAGLAVCVDSEYLPRAVILDRYSD